MRKCRDCNYMDRQVSALEMRDRMCQPTYMCRNSKAKLRRRNRRFADEACGLFEQAEQGREDT